MSIQLVIEAEDAEDLRKQLHILLGAALVRDTLVETIKETLAEKIPGIDPSIHAQPVDNGEKVAQPEEKTEPEQQVSPPSKPRRAHRRTKPEPQSPAEPSDDKRAPAKADGNGAATEAPSEDADIFGDTTEIDPVAAQKVKDEVLPKLRDLFVSGQVKQVRAILDKFGDGAKSIPEIDAKHFPAIRDFLGKAA
jgi:outer membrane biosynthesis protein TonB